MHTGFWWGYLRERDAGYISGFMIYEFIFTMPCCRFRQNRQVRKRSRAYERCSVALTEKTDRYTLLCCTLQPSY